MEKSTNCVNLLTGLLNSKKRRSRRKNNASTLFTSIVIPTAMTLAFQDKCIYDMANLTTKTCVSSWSIHKCSSSSCSTLLLAFACSMSDLLSDLFEDIVEFFKRLRAEFGGVDRLNQFIHSGGVVVRCCWSPRWYKSSSSSFSFSSSSSSSSEQRVSPKRRRQSIKAPI